LGELTTGVAHELNNPLNNIGLYVGNVIDQFEVENYDRDRVLHALTQAMQQVAKATEIINHLRTFGRAAPATRQAVSINQVITRSIALLREQLRLREIELLLDLDPLEPQVLGNPIQLEQVFMNLLTNARDAVSESNAKLLKLSSRVEGTAVRIEVDDTGPGIPDALAQRVFDPFFTTKEVGEGTGLGLSIVYGIIKDHDGTISVERAPGGGARFAIQLATLPENDG
jgi:C4-dicarboxylate-specific signal transduction histidine kinase